MANDLKRGSGSKNVTPTDTGDKQQYKCMA